MRLTNGRARVGASALVGFLVASCGSMGTRPGQVTSTVKPGQWGGQHIAMSVEASKTDIEFDCGRATITGAIDTDRDGAFTATGTFLQERPGPTTPDGPAPRPMRVTGAVKGDDM